MPADEPFAPFAALVHEVSRTPRRRSSPAGSSRRITSVICGPANAVFRYKALAPSFEHASVASMKPRWLRHMIATLSPSLMPAARISCASAFVRRCTSSKVNVPRSSTIASRSGKRAAEPVYAAAGVGPQRLRAMTDRTARSGLTGVRMPVPSSTLAASSLNLFAELTRAPYPKTGPVHLTRRTAQFTSAGSSLPCRRSRPRCTAAMNFERLTSKVPKISSA